MPKKKQSLPKVGKKYLKNNFEFAVWKALKNLLPRGAQLDYETERLTYTITSDYIPDFVITKKDGGKIYIEAKGNGRSFDSKVQQKMIAVKNQHPDKDIRIVFTADGKIGSVRKNGSYRRQSDWSRDNGFVFSIREIPLDWFKE